MVAAGTLMVASSHNFDTLDQPYREQGEVSNGTKIGKNCWIGARCTILDGVELGDNVIVAAGSVVNKSWPKDLLIGGTPAKPIKQYDHKSKQWLPAK